MYGADRERSVHLPALGVPLATIVDVHLRCDEYLSLKNYLARLQRQLARNPAA